MSRQSTSNSNDERPATSTMVRNLVVLPGLIVLAVVLIALTFAWVTHPAGNVEALLETLAQPGRARWPAAVTLAAMLNEPGHAGLKEDAHLARRLSDILQEEIDAGRTDEDSIRLRMYLCRTLGEFHLVDALPVLLAAADRHGAEKQPRVRRAAIEAIAVLASNVGVEPLRGNDELRSCLSTAAKDANRQVRCAAAFTWGVVGGIGLERELETLLADEYPEIRYNAATSLARHGQASCVDTLLEMLDPPASAADRGFPPAMIQLNALRAIDKLIAADPMADRQRLADAVEPLTHSDIEAPIRLKALEVLRELRRRQP